MLQKQILKDWINELKTFAKEPEYRHLRFPMFMESNKGDLFSPEGILCNLHSKQNTHKWMPEQAPDKKLRGCVHYDGNFQNAPECVLEWLGMGSTGMSEMRRHNAEGGFDAVIKYLEQL